MKIQYRFLLCMLVCISVFAFAPLSQQQARAATTANRSLTFSPENSTSPLPYPSWWNGTLCDTTVIHDSAPLGASYRGMPACGSRFFPSKSLPIVTFPGGWGQLEWQCVELSMRYLYLAYGIYAYPADGKDVVWNYSGTLLQKIHNDGMPHVVPAPGDVLSYNPTPTNPYGHTSIVTNTSIDSAGNGSITILEQNGSPSGADRLDVINWVVTPGWATVSGWLHYSGASVSASATSGPKKADVYALNASTGSVRWRYKTGSFIPSATTIAHETVYASSLDHFIYALDASNGTLLWRYQTGGPIHAAPLVLNGVVYIGSSDSSLYALNARSGALLWRYQAGASIDTQAVAANGHIYFSASDNDLYALNTSFGSLLWRYHTAGKTLSAPALRHGIIYAGSDDGNIYAVNALDGALLWTYQTGTLVASSPTLSNGILYAGVGNTSGGSIYALNASNGSLLWRYQTSGGINAASVVVKTLLYASASNGYVYALNSKNGELVWRYQVDNKIGNFTPTVMHGVVYIGSADHAIYALNAADGSLLWYYQAGNTLDVASAIGPQPKRDS